MGPVGSPTLRAHKILQQDVTSIRQRLESVRTEAVTGRVSDVARAVDGDTAKVNRLSANIEYAESRATALDFEGNRAKSIQSALTNIRESLGVVRNAATLALGDTAPKALDSAAALGESGFSNAVAVLNSEFAGRPMFGGDSGVSPLTSAEDMLGALRSLVATAPDTATALTDIDTYFNDPAGGFATGFLGGDGDAPSVELSRTERIPASVRADEEAVRTTLHSFALATLAGEAGTLEDQRSYMAASSGKLGIAIEDTIELQSQLGVREERIATAQSNYQGQSATLSIAMNGLTGRDQAEAASEMRVLESQLEAAYLTTSRLAGLSLTNFLR